jgi:GNAT superfamily N-acetyltransferase
MSAAAAVAGRGMRDNPTHLVWYGEDPARREAGQTALVARGASVLGWSLLGAYDDSGTLVGIAGHVAPGACQPTPAQRLRLLPLATRLGPRTFARIGRTLTTWSENDSPVVHTHVGPVAVERHLQGRGIGTALMAALGALVDSTGTAAFLETDKPENVTFYRRAGYEVVAEAEPGGVRTWFMLRTAIASR